MRRYALPTARSFLHAQDVAAAMGTARPSKSGLSNRSAGRGGLAVSCVNDAFGVLLMCRCVGEALGCEVKVRDADGGELFVGSGGRACRDVVVGHGVSLFSPVGAGCQRGSSIRNRNMGFRNGCSRRFRAPAPQRIQVVLEAPPGNLRSCQKPATSGTGSNGRQRPSFLWPCRGLPGSR